MSSYPNLKMSSAGGGQQGMVWGQEGTAGDRSERRERQGTAGDGGGRQRTAQVISHGMKIILS